MKKGKLYLKSVVMRETSNNIRTILSVLGVFVGVVLMTCALFLMDAYYNGCMEEIEAMPEGAFVVLDVNDNDVDEILEGAGSISSHQLLYSSDKYEYYKNVVNDKHIYYRTCIVGSPVQDAESLYKSDRGMHLTSVKLIEGRLIDNEDVENHNRVVVIDKYAAEKIASAGNEVIGKEIALNLDSKVFKYQVVGVVEPNYYTKETMKKLPRMIEGKEEAIYIDTTMYIPYSSFVDELSQDDYSRAIIYNDNNANKLNSAHDYIATMQDGRYKEQIRDVSSEKQIVMESIEIYKEAFLIVILIVFLFAGLNSMNVFFFSLKERIPEIGIRKAYGASRINIVSQFVLESILISLAASIIGISLSIIITILGIPALYDLLEINLVFKFKIELIMLPLCVSILQGMVFSIIPGIYASRIKIIDAIRFE